MDKEVLTRAMEDIKRYPKSFLEGYDMLSAFQTIDREIAERTDDTDTLSVSVPTDALEDLSKLCTLIIKRPDYSIFRSRKSSYLNILELKG